MKRAVRVAHPDSPPAPTATYVVKFAQRPKRAPRAGLAAPGRSVPRVARLLALAHRIDGMIRTGELRDWADAARLAGFSRARMTQIANLLLLAPNIQERILNVSNVTRGQDPVAERTLRNVTAQADWKSQNVQGLEPQC